MAKFWLKRNKNKKVGGATQLTSSRRRDVTNLARNLNFRVIVIFLSHHTIVANVRTIRGKKIPINMNFK